MNNTIKTLTPLILALFGVAIEIFGVAQGQAAQVQPFAMVLGGAAAGVAVGPIGTKSQDGENH